MWLQGDGQDEHIDEQDEKIDLVEIFISLFTPWGSGVGAPDGAPW